MNEAASQLGRLAKGVPKKYTRTERERRRNVMIAMNKKRRKQKRAKLRAELNKKQDKNLGE